MLHLATNVFVAPVRERAVVLDLVRDKYLALGGGAARVVLQVAAGVAPDPGTDLVRTRTALIANGLLAEAAGPPAATAGRAPPALPGATLWPSPPRGMSPTKSASAGMFWSILRDLALAWTALRVLPFHAAVGWVARTRLQPRRGEVQHLLDAYFAARPWFPIQPICRLDAVALCRHLRRHGCAASLVFGVKLEPFRAHCWVQCDGRVLNEPHEIVARFTPIMKA